MLIRSAELWGGLFWLALGAFVTWSGNDLGLGQQFDRTIRLQPPDKHLDLTVLEDSAQCCADASTHS